MILSTKTAMLNCAKLKLSELKMDLKREFCDLRNKIIEKEFSRLNSMQFEAVTSVNGPLLILSGAGSGKTTVLINRIVNMIKFGEAYGADCGDVTEADV